MYKVALSTAGARFLGVEEGCVLQPYNDSEGHATIGIGHLISWGAVTPAMRRAWGTITYAHALALCQADAHANGIVPLQQALRVGLTQPQKDMLLSLGFNCGPGSLSAGHTVMAAVNSKPKVWNARQLAAWHSRVEAAFMAWAHPSELTRRRHAEAYCFATGHYTYPQNPYSHERAATVIEDVASRAGRVVLADLVSERLPHGMHATA